MARRQATAFVLLPWVGHHYPTLFALTLIPGLLAVAAIRLLVQALARTQSLING